MQKGVKKPKVKVCRTCKEEFETVVSCAPVCEFCKVRVPAQKNPKKRKVVKVVVEK